MASDDIPKEIEMLMEKVYDQFRQIYASTTYDSDTKVRMLGTDRPRDGVHSGKWVVVSTNEYREEITVGMKRGGVAGNFAKKQTVSFENATVNDVMEMARSYIPENRVWNEEEVVEDTNPATVEREVEAVKEEMGEDMVLPSETRGMMMKLQSVLQSQYGYVDVREQGSEGIEIQVKHSAPPKRH